MAQADAAPIAGIVFLVVELHNGVGCDGRPVEATPCEVLVAGPSGAYKLAYPYGLLRRLAVHHDGSSLDSIVVMLLHLDLAVGHILRHDEADFGCRLAELALLQRVLQSGHGQLDDAVEVLSGDGKGHASLHVLAGINALKDSQRHGDVGRGSDAGGR